MSKSYSNPNLAWNSFKLLFFSRAFWRNHIVAILLGGSILLNFIVWYLWYFKIRVSGYPVYSPISLLKISEKLHFYFLPIIGVLVILLNTFLAIYAFRKESLTSYFLLGTAFFIQILILVFLLFFIRFSLT